jgi:hypothetical protein
MPQAVIRIGQGHALKMGQPLAQPGRMAIHGLVRDVQSAVLFADRLPRKACARLIRSRRGLAGRAGSLPIWRSVASLAGIIAAGLRPARHLLRALPTAVRTAPCRAYIAKSASWGLTIFS